jgi:hypothetical protein
MCNRIPAPEHVEATLTANVMLHDGISLWELEYLFAQTYDADGRETRGIVWHPRRGTLTTPHLETGEVMQDGRGSV